MLRIEILCRAAFWRLNRGFRLFLKSNTMKSSVREHGSNLLVESFMQISELYRQSVVLPLDRQAEECLRAGEIDSGVRVRRLEIPNNKVIGDLWQLRLFEQINAKCAGLIDEYEEAWIDASAMTEMLTVIDSVAAVTSELDTRGFLDELRGLVVEARTISRSLLFVL